MKKIRNSFFLKFGLLLILTFVGLFFRINNLTTLPSEMHRDEIDIGYNAYSILKTGYDEHGKLYPFIFESFGDYKLPGMIYLVAPSIKFFGLNTFAVRLPNVILSTLLIPLLYFFVLEIFDKSRDKIKLALISSTLLTFSYWHIFLSRTVYEPIAGLTLHVLAMLLLLKARKKPAYFLLTLVVYLISFSFYNLPLLLSPFLILAILFIYRKDFFNKNNSKKSSIFLVAFFVLIGAVLFSLSGLTAGKSETTILNNEHILRESQKFADQFFVSGKYRIFGKLYTHRFFVSGMRFVKNYLATFDPNYLFFNGGSNVWHSLSFISLGNFNPAYFILVILGFLGIILDKDESLKNSKLFLLAFLFLSPIPDALTIDAPVTNRLMSFHLSFLLLAAFGFYWAVYKINYRKIAYKIIVSFLLIFMTLVFFGNFFTRYTTLHSLNLSGNWHPGLTEVFNKIDKLQNDYDKIYFNPETSGFPKVISSYVYYAFYTEYEPAEFRKNAVWIRDNDFHRVEELNPFYVRTFDSAYADEASKVLYVTRVGGSFDDIKNEAKNNENILAVIRENEYSPTWVIYGYSF